MTRDGIAEKICEENPTLNRKDVDVILRRAFEIIAGEVANGRSVMISKFGTFHLVKTKAKKVQDFKGNTLDMPERLALKFKVSGKLKSSLE